MDINSPGVDQLTLILEEAVRSSDEGIRRFVPPSANALGSAKARGHHIVFGRRGSGKSSLLRKAASDLTLDRRPIAYVDVETFKAHSYPDVLLSILIKTLEEFSAWLTTAGINPSNKKSFWRLRGGATPERPALNKASAQNLANDIDTQISTLRDQLYSADLSEAQLITRMRRDTASQNNLSVKAELADVGASLSLGDSSGARQEEEQQRRFTLSKVEFLHQHIMEYQQLFRRMAELSNGDAYLFLDDLYHIRKVDQPRVLDYFHRIAKGNRLWLKVGTIRHRTRHYVHGDPPTGLKLGDDANEIDLDLTLEKFNLTKRFLTDVLQTIIDDIGSDGLSVSDILVDDGLIRLVLASGGVARDFLGIFRRAIYITREREGRHRGAKVGTEDINSAAGEYDGNKRDEFELDVPDEREYLERAFENVRSFCFHRSNSNIILVDKDIAESSKEPIAELVDLRLLHKVRSRLTSWNREGNYYEAYMLDISQYTGSRKRHNFKMVTFWRGGSDDISDNHVEDNLRKASYIYNPVEDYTQLGSQVRAKGSKKTSDSGPEPGKFGTLWGGD